METAPVGTANFKRVTVATKQIGLYTSNLGVVGSNLYLFAGGTAQNYGVGVLLSSDEGRTWHQVNPDPCGNREFSFFANNDIAADDGALIVSCVNKLSVAPPGSTHFSTPRPYPRGRIVSAVAAESANVITAADISNGYIGGQGPLRTTFYRTTDGGSSWQRGETLPVNGHGFSFTNQFVGYAAAADGGSMYVTHDGGLTWKRMSFAS